MNQVTRDLFATGVTCGLALCARGMAAPPEGGSPEGAKEDARGAGIVTFHDNGLPDGVNAYSNVTEFTLGARRTLLDDFVVTDASWTLNGIRHRGIWDTLPPGSGLGMEVVFRADAGGTPGPVVAEAHVTGYAEEATGDAYFDRAEYDAWATFTDVTLSAGRYWLEATTVGPENNFWLTAPQLNEECWVDYEDVTGLTPGSEMFGRAADLSWQLFGGLCAAATDCCFPDGTCANAPSCDDCAAMGGEPVLACAGCRESCVGDINHNNAIDFPDLLELLASWGPCDAECPADLDGDESVGLTDLLVILTSWGPCP